MNNGASSRRRALETGLGVPFLGGNTLTVLRNGDEIFPAMLDAVEAAERSIDLSTFVYWEGDIAERFADALAERAADGVRVRVLLDGVGCLKMPDRLVARMRQAGAEVRIFRPPRTLRLWRLDHRTHRKILVCDDKLGFTGGVGIASEWQGDARHPGEWRDTHLRVEGPAVDGLMAGFAGNWMEVAPDVADREAPPANGRSGSSDVLVLRSCAAVAWSDVTLLYHLIVTGARRRLRIATPYFVPDRRSVELLAEAAHRGVDIEILVAGEHNDSRLSQWAGRRHYAGLVAAGARLWHYERTMLHTKVITVDGELAVLGSPNFNQRSMQKDDELCMVIDDAEVAGQLDLHFDEDLEHAVELDGGRWSERPWYHRLGEACAGLVRHEV